MNTSSKSLRTKKLANKCNAVYSTGTQVQEEGNYIEGKLDGPVYHYSENGALMKTVNYNMGEIIE